MSVSIKDPLNELFSISLSGLPIVEFSNLPLNSLLFIFFPVTIIGFNSSTFLVFKSQNTLFAHTIFSLVFKLDKSSFSGEFNTCFPSFVYFLKSRGASLFHISFT